MTTAVAMSGGVDSSVVAALLAENNSEAGAIVGLTMQLWNQRRLPSLLGGGHASGRCCSLDDVYDARRVADFLGIPFYVVNLESQFEETVVRPFVKQYLAGETPIPCSLCNTEIKFAQFIETARQIGAERIATGHYARIRRDETTGRYRLFAGVDRSRDQSYFLFGLTQEQLSRSLFPLGEMQKDEVRDVARAKGLPVASKPDSQEICFVPTGNYTQFIEAYLAERGEKLEEPAGEVVTTDGRVIGRHEGLYHYTVGQRKRLGVAVGEPLYVISLVRPKNRVVVGRNEELRRRRLVVRDVNWIWPACKGETVEADVKIRNKHVAARALVKARTDRTAAVEFTVPQRAVTPGQAAVFYSPEEDREVFGGGWIARVED